jgi:hypothetical protein
MDTRINISSMKINLSDKIIAWLALLSGLTISAVAIWYSVAGLVSIFAAAVIPIIVMGVVLEISKLIATVWLKINWTRAPIFIRTYLLVAIAVLMVITSMGIFGFLSKAHSDQSLVSGDVQAKIAVYDDKIKSAKDNIDANRKALKQMDEAVDQVMARSSSETGADKAVAIRRAQQKERARLQSEIQAEQKIITAVSEERAPIAAEVRKVEAEVGPIKYIANFIYGDNPDANILEKAVTWVIIIIVAVFDPLAVILLLASQYSFQWFRKAKEEENETPPSISDFVPQPQTLIVEDEAPIERDLVAEGNAAIAEIEPPEQEIELLEPVAELPEEAKSQPFYGTPSPVWPFPAANHTQEPTHTETVVDPIETQPTALGGDITAPEELHDEDDDFDDEDDSAEIREAKKNWKHDHPDDNLKRHKRLFEKGLIDRLPWDDYLTAKPDFTDNEAAEEAAKWALEQVEESKKKGSDLDGTGTGSTDSQDAGRIEGYIQNAEQSELTLWQRVKQAKGQE